MSQDKVTVLITGAGPNGVTGRRLREWLEATGRYVLLTPSSRQLDLTDTDAVDAFFAANRVDVVVHSAVVAPSRGHDASDESMETENNLRMYFNLVRHCSEFSKMFYFGSGAELDKRQPIVRFREEDAHMRMPRDKYGFIKHMLNAHAEGSSNVYNMRLFGSINPYEPPTRNVVSNLCAKAAAGVELNLRQDCVFSFIDMDDVARFIDYGINNPLKHHTYNMSGGVFTIEQIARQVAACAGRTDGAVFANPGQGNEYTADNTRLLECIGEATPLAETIAKVYAYVSRLDNGIDGIDGRWK